MAEKTFELFQVPQTQKITTFQTYIIPTLPSSTPLPIIIPNDAVSSNSNSDSNSNPNPPLYQLFSENRQQREYGAVSLLDDKLIQSSVPLGPFTGYASILKRSTFLKPAQQLLEDFCGSGFRISEDPATAALSLSSGDKYRVGFPFKDSRLVFLLDEVYNRCKLYCQQIQSVVTSFESVAGLGNAAPFISSAIRAISSHFGCLKNAILDHLHFTSKTSSTCTNLADTSHDLVKDDEIPRLFLSSKASCGRNPTHNFSSLRNPVWRSQRGLPDHAVAMLKKWLFEHFLHPYPTDSEKHMLAQQTGLSRAQISNWFINSRVRLWKPMVEEIHVLQAHKTQVPRHSTETTPISLDNLRDVSSKRSRNERRDSSSSPCTRGEKERRNEVAYAGDYANNSSSGSSASLALNLRQNLECSEAAFRNWF